MPSSTASKSPLSTWSPFSSCDPNSPESVKKKWSCSKGPGHQRRRPPCWGRVHHQRSFPEATRRAIRRARRLRTPRASPRMSERGAKNRSARPPPMTSCWPRPSSCRWSTPSRPRNRPPPLGRAPLLRLRRDVPSRPPPRSRPSATTRCPFWRSAVPCARVAAISASPRSVVIRLRHSVVTPH